MAAPIRPTKKAEPCPECGNTERKGVAPGTPQRVGDGNPVLCGNGHLIEDKG